MALPKPSRLRDPIPARTQIQNLTDRLDKPASLKIQNFASKDMSLKTLSTAEHDQCSPVDCSHSVPQI